MQTPVSTVTKDTSELALLPAADYRGELKAAKRKVRELGRKARAIASKYSLVEPLTDEPLLRTPQLRLLVQNADLATLDDFERQLDTLCVMMEKRGQELERIQREIDERAAAEKAVAEAAAELEAADDEAD